MVSIDDIVVDPPAEGAVWQGADIFGRPGPFELEIGCGKGGFLLSRAKAKPDTHLLGIEWANKYFKYCADRMVRWQMTNVRVMRTDAKIFVLRHLAENTLSVLHVYHPDPWPKKRHHRRRLIQPPFVDAACRALRPGGYFMLQSDHAEYFEQILDVMGNEQKLIQVDWEETGVSADEDWQGTNFEIKYTREGRPIYRAAYQRVNPAAQQPEKRKRHDS